MTQPSVRAISAACVALLSILINSTTHAVFEQTPVQDDTPSKIYSVPDLVKEMSPAVVYIAGLDDAGRPVRAGSGFVVRSDGVVVTNYHLIDGIEHAFVKTQDGEIYDRVDVLDYDRRRDIAVLKIQPYGVLPTLMLAEEDSVLVGESAAAIGNPQGLEHTVSAGIISGFRQAEGYRVIQTTVPLSPGSSGGPLFSMDGRVVGITSMQLLGEGTQNLNFAVPIGYVRPLLKSSSPPTPLVDFARRMASMPPIGSTSASEDVADTRNTPSTESSWRVIHGHGDTTFRDYCSGTLSVASGVISFLPTFGSHGFSTSLTRVSIGNVSGFGLNLVVAGSTYVFRLAGGGPGVTASSVAARLREEAGR